jgi:hypothetical protein
MAYDINGYSELQSYSTNGTRVLETYLEVGKDIPTLFRPYVSAQWFADNVQGSWKNESVFYRLGMSKEMGNVTVYSGAIFNQNLGSNTKDNYGYFVKASFAYDSEKK